MIGQQVWEYSHQCDHAELREMLQGRRGKEPSVEEQVNMHRDLLVRFKCTLTSRGRSVNIKSASYKVLCPFLNPPISWLTKFVLY